MSKPPRLYVFFHLARMGSFWREVAEYLGGAIDGSGLHNAAEHLHCVTVGADDLNLHFLPFDSDKWSVEDGGGLLEYEYPTLCTLWAFAKEHPNDYVLYIHSKGVRSDTDDDRCTRAKWRRWMTYQVITRWRECVAKLDEGYDTVGGWSVGGEYPHYAGNFWWAKCSWINHLPEPRMITDCGNRRIWAEFWLCSGYPKAFEIAAPAGGLHEHYKRIYHEEAAA